MQVLLLVGAVLVQIVALMRAFEMRRYLMQRRWVYVALTTTLALMLVRRVMAVTESLAGRAGTFEFADGLLTLATSLGVALFIEAALIWLRDLEAARGAIVEGEDRFMTLVDSLDDMVFIQDTGGRYVAMYGRWMAEHGLTNEDFVGKRPRDVLPPVTADVISTYNARALAGETVAYEKWLEMPWGRVCYHTVVAPIQDAAWRTTGVVGVSRDVTELRDASDELKRQKDYAEGIIDAADIMIVVLDAEWRVRVFNRVAEQLTGVAREKVIGRDWFDTEVPDAAFRSVWDLRVSGRGPAMSCDFERSEPFSTSVDTSSGKRALVSWRLAAISDGQRCAGVVVLGTDVTATQKLERDLHKASASDPLTGLASRPAFERMLAAEIDRVAEGETASLLLIKVGGLDECAARYGQVFADNALVDVAEAVSTHLRSADRLGRVGGSQLAALVLGGDEAEVNRMAEALHETASGVDSRDVDLDVAVGVVALGAGIPFEDAYDAAVAAMYRAYHSGSKVAVSDK